MTRICFSVLAVATVVLLGAFSMTALSQDLFTQKVLSLDLAQTIAQGAITQCRADGYKVSATILDGGGALKTFIRDDGAGLGTIDISRKKAYTALIFKRTSAEMGKAFAALNPPPNIEGTLTLGGGVPIKVGEETIGAIGVSGAPGGEKDEACANAALAKVAGKLK
jgi:uncharacterized protein GlcG (DUF336 family)